MVILKKLIKIWDIEKIFLSLYNKLKHIVMKIKVPFTLPTPDFKDSERKELNVDMNIPDSLTVNGNIEYSVVIPDYMFNELADTEPQFKTVYDQNNRNVSGLFSERSITRKFKKTQTSLLISSLQEYICSLTQFINDRHSVETSTMKKKIFISFKHSDSHTTNGLNGAYTGKQISQSFRYFTGYEVMTSKFSSISESMSDGTRKVKKQYISKIFYSSPGSSLRKLDTNFEEKEDLFLTLLKTNQNIQDFETEYSIIDWSEEREKFCEKIQETFKNVNEELDNFLSNIDDDKMDMLISNGGLKFLTA